MEVLPLPNIAKLAKSIDNIRRLLPPLEKLLYKAFWFLFAVIEMARFLLRLWKT